MVWISVDLYDRKDQAVILHCAAGDESYRDESFVKREDRQSVCSSFDRVWVNGDGVSIIVILYTYTLPPIRPHPHPKHVRIESIDY